MDARRDERIPIGMPIRLRIRDIDSFTEEYTTDLSSGGIFIEMEDPPPAGVIVHLEFYLEAVEKSIWATGEVVRSIPESTPDGERAGAGIEFVDLGAEGRRFIDLVVEKYRKLHPDQEIALPGELRERVQRKFRIRREQQWLRGDSIEIRLRSTSIEAFREENFESLWNREIFVEADDPLPVGTVVRLRVSIERENLCLVTEAEVVRLKSNPDLESGPSRRGMVLAFPELTLPMQDLLVVSP